jgi:hypothetical protein
MFFQRLLNSLSSIPFIGDPCPMKRTGIAFSSSTNVPAKLLNAANVDIAAARVINFKKCFRSTAVDFLQLKMPAFLAGIFNNLIN